MALGLSGLGTISRAMSQRKREEAARKRLEAAEGRRAAMAERQFGLQERQLEATLSERERVRKAQMYGMLDNLAQRLMEQRDENNKALYTAAEAEARAREIMTERGYELGGIPSPAAPEEAPTAMKEGFVPEEDVRARMKAAGATPEEIETQIALGETGLGWWGRTKRFVGEQRRGVGRAAQEAYRTYTTAYPERYPLEERPAYRRTSALRRWLASREQPVVEPSREVQEKRQPRRITRGPGEVGEWYPGKGPRPQPRPVTVRWGEEGQLLPYTLTPEERLEPYHWGERFAQQSARRRR